MDGGQKEPWEVTSAPFDDPDMAPFAGPEPPEPGVLDPGCYWRLRPGEPLDEITELPRHQHDQPVVFFGGPQRRLLLDTPHGRKILAAAGSCAGVPAENVAQKIVVIYALHRATGHIDDADRFLVVLNSAGDELARLDFSSSWELRTDSLRRICGLAGMAFAEERYPSEAELLATRPQWTPAHVDLEVEHPLEADIRDIGMSLWLGTGIALALVGAAGMQFVFGTPVKYVVLTAAVGGLITATVITAWSNVRWKKRRLRRRRLVHPHSPAGEGPTLSRGTGPSRDREDDEARAEGRPPGRLGALVLRLLGYRPQSEDPSRPL
jgi:hypothetical protein